jgi:threonine/homoserine/homoserine lactone efflux protein
VPAADRVLTFALTSLVLIVIPGPSVLFTIGRALSIGRRGAVRSLVGNATGCYLQIAAVAFGIGALVERSSELYLAIKYVGAAYLVFLGVQAFRRRRVLADTLATTAAPARSTVRQFLDGVLVGASNPKTIVFFTVAMPQFADSDAGHLPVQLLVLGSVFPVIGIVCDSMWAFVAGSAREWLARSPRRLAAVGGTGGLAIAGLGVTVAVTGGKD